jgi:RNA polymerase sigma-70 factor (ECF subfamily)
MARYFGVDSAEMDDVVQDVFVAVYNQLGNLRQPSAIRSWLYTIVKRTSCAYYRGRRTLVESNGSGWSEPEVEQVEWLTPQRALEHAEQLELLHTLLDKLDAPKREVIILADLEEMSMPDIARMTGVPLNTLYSRLRTSRIELEEAFHRHQAKYSSRAGNTP